VRWFPRSDVLAAEFENLMFSLYGPSQKICNTVIC
jgi:hypothetical protein